jgi:hypothetical protein
MGQTETPEITGTNCQTRVATNNTLTASKVKGASPTCRGCFLFSSVLSWFPRSYSHCDKPAANNFLFGSLQD